MKVLYKSIIIILCLMVTLSLWGCDEKKVLESTKEDLTIVKTVDGIDITLELYRYVALNYKMQYEAGSSAEMWLGEEGKEALDRINRDIDDTLVKLHATISMCNEYGIDVNDSYITDTLEIYMDEIYETYDYDYKAYVSEIAEYNMTDAVYRFLVRNDILAEELLAKMAENGEVPVDRDEVLGILNSDECVRVKQILISADNGKSDEDNLSRAKDLLEKAKSGKDFDELVQKYGEDLFMFNNDDGYYITKGRLHKEFEDAAYALEVGEISDIIKTPSGYSILKKYEKDPEYIEKNFDYLLSEYISGLYNLKLEEYSTHLTIENTEKTAKYSIFNLKK